MLKKLSQYIDFGSSAPQGQKDNHRSTQKKQSDAADSFDFLSLIKGWRDIAGEKLSEHTIPLKNQNGTLVILSNHSAFANELSYMEILLKKKIFTQFPSLEKSIKNIKFIVDSTHFDKQYNQFIVPAQKIKKQNQNTLHQFSPEFIRLRKEAEEIFKDMEDEEVKKSMISLYIQSGNFKP